MKNYSLRNNFNYMAMTFYKPCIVIDFLIKDAPYVYSIMPIVIFTVLFEISYIDSYVSNAPTFFHFLSQILKIPDHQYDFYQIFLFPIVHIVDFFLFGGVIYFISRLMLIEKLDIVKTIFFFCFTWNTIGILGFITESLAIKGGIKLFFLFNPIYAITAVAYTLEFMHKQASISRWKSLVPSVSGVIIFLGFRVLFLG